MLIDTTNYNPPKPPEPPEIPKVDARIIKTTAFRDRFTFMEKARIDLASLDNPQDTQDNRLRAAGLRASMKDLELRPEVDLDSPGLRSRLQILQGMNLLDSESRIDEILSAPIELSERP
jgi:hypothetical protein